MNCPICKENQGFSYVTKVTSPPHFVTQLEFGKVLSGVIVQYSRCNVCGVILQNPRMSDEEVEAFYTSGAYRKSMLNMSVEEIDLDELNRANDNVEFLVDVPKPEKHLDIGCARGFFLGAMGADVQVGVELIEDYPIHKPAIYYKKLDDVKEKQFDFVSMVHTLEHVVDPMGLLLQATRKVKKGGHVYIEVPSASSPGGWGRLGHTFHFEPHVMRYMLKKAKLTIEKESIELHYQILTKK